MKLSPHASSSDLDLARDVARRLHQRRRRDDRPGTTAARAERAAEARPAPARRIEPVAVPQAPVHVSPAPWDPPPSRVSASAPAPVDAKPEEPAPPTWDAPAEASPTFADNQEPDDALDALTAGGPPAPDEPPSPVIDVEDEAESEAGPPATFEEADAYGGAPAATPFDDADALAPPDIEPGALPADDEGSDVSPFEPPLGVSEAAPEEEELFDAAPPGPSWGDVAERCRGLAHARGALLADTGGELIAARGEWPEPGAEAIASRLVAMMDRTLKDAPTRSVSAPVGALHLTAWRVPVEGRLLTVVFIADAQVRADTRPAIDAEVQRGTVRA